MKTYQLTDKQLEFLNYTIPLWLYTKYNQPHGSRSGRDILCEISESKFYTKYERKRLNELREEYLQLQRDGKI